MWNNIARIINVKWENSEVTVFCNAVTESSSDSILYEISDNHNEAHAKLLLFPVKSSPRCCTNRLQKLDKSIRQSNSVLLDSTKLGFER